MSEQPGQPAQQTPKESAPLPAGTIIAKRYQVESLLGAGAMGSVYRVEHLGIKKRMALKMLRPELMAMPAVLARFQREAVAAAHLDHPHVAAAVDYGQADDGRWYLVLEYIEGRELRQEIDRVNGPFPPARALFITRQVVSALVRSHSVGIVHRDLKPENIMLVQRDGNDDFVKVLDFGLAHASSPLAKQKDASAAPDPSNYQLTQLGEVIGTPAYMAPEQAFGGVADIRSDLYAVGVMLYELLTGLRPFKGNASLVLIYQALTEKVPPLAVRARGVSVPEELEALVLKLLAKEPEARVQTPTELLAALDEIVEKHRLKWQPGTEPGAAQAAPEIKAAGPSMPSALGWISTAVGSRFGKMMTAARPRAARVAERVRLLLPEPMRKVPLPVILGVPALVLGLVLVRWLMSDSEPARTAAPVLPLPAAGAPVPAGAPQAMVDAATAQGVDALLALERQYPADARIKHALVRAYGAQSRYPEAMQAIAQAAPVDPMILQDEEVMKVLTAAIQGPAEAAQAAATLLESGLGEAGIDLLFDFTSKQSKIRGKSRLQQSLGKPEVLARASVPTRVALELRAAKSCEAKRALLPRVQQEGDQRALGLLKALAQTQGCGFMGDEDCWGCLRKTTELQDAVAALEARVK
ncbi:MAG: serine/threonine-protein kinase [Polyangia bacterium]